jgi:CRISPR-associated endonuclease Cas2
MLFLVSYDLPSSQSGDRRRARLARYLQSVGIRVQWSVFELDIDPQKLGSVCLEWH